MKRIAVALAVYAVLVAMVLAGSASPSEARGGGSAAYVPDEIIVRFADGVDARAQGEVNSRHGGQEIDDLGGIRAKVVRVAAGSVERALRAYRAESAVRYAEPNYIVHAITPGSRPLAALPNDPRFGELWGLKNTGQVIGGVAGTPGADIKAESAWNTTTGSASVIVGVVDTGIDYNHPDLAANVWSNPGGIGGCPAGTRGFRAIGNTTSCDPLDDHDHGSHVSGTIGAVGNNGIGVVGVNWNVRLMGLKFLDSAGSGSTANAIKVIDFAVNAKIAGQNVRVLSNSWGGGGFSQALLDAINRANANDILFVAAAGNSAADNDVTPHFPSSYSAPNVVAVAATDNTDALASFSNFGATSVHLGAPGVNTLSTTRNNTYAFFSGTSMATPHVSGVAALVLAAKPTLTTAQLKSEILSNVDPIPALAGITVTGGRLNAAKAVGAAPPPPPTPDFSLSVTPSSATVTAGAGASYTASITRTGGFTGAVTLSVSGLPAGAAGTFSPNPASGATSALSVTTSTSTPAGTYPLTITGVSGSLTRTAGATLVVNAAAAPDFTLSISPSSVTVPAAGGTASYTVNITRAGGFTGGVTFSISGLPAGASGTFSPNPASGTTSSLTVTVASTTAAGSFVFTVTGTGGTLTRTATATLVKSPAAPCQDECDD